MGVSGSVCGFALLKVTCVILFLDTAVQHKIIVFI